MAALAAGRRARACPTYVAGFAASLLTLLYYISLVSGMNSRRN